MFKRLMAILALGAVLAACSPASSSPGGSDVVTDSAAPSESLGTESASPSP